MEVNKKAIISLLGLKPSGGRGWYVGDCVFCKKKAHMGIDFGKKLGFNCFKCGKKGSILFVLKAVGREDLATGQRLLVASEIMGEDLDIGTPIHELDTTTPTVKKPLGFSSMNYHPYLKGRGFTKDQYDIFSVGISSLDPKYTRGYIIFLVMEGGKCVGHLGRSTWTKDEIDAYNAKREGMSKYAKYNNSESDFRLLLFGIDEVVAGETHTVVLVEGVTDKANVDRSLNLYDSSEMKCCVLFGKKVSDIQLAKLYNKGVRKIVLFLDPEAVKEIKNYATAMTSNFDVKVAYNKNREIDVGDMSRGNIEAAIMNPMDVMKFYFSVM